MNILQTPIRFFPFIGGVENYAYNLSKEMVKLGHSVKVICANEPWMVADAEIDGIKIKRLSYIGKLGNTNIMPKFFTNIVQEKFDLIHTYFPSPWSPDVSAFVGKIKKKPTVLSYCNDIITDYHLEGFIAKTYNTTLLRFTLKLADKIIILQPNYITQSSYLKPYKNKIECIPVGVDTKKFEPTRIEKHNENVLFFLSVLDESHQYKGLNYLLRALRIVKKDVKDVTLIIGGGGKLQKYYKEMADSLGIKNSVKFVGVIPDDEIVEYYNKCDVFVLPSSEKQEGFGIVLLEALACKKPIVSTEIVGIAKDVKERNVGRIVAPKDVTGLARGIVEILSDKENAKRMGKEGRELIEEKYSWKVIGKIFERVYLSLIEA